jgi:hypothetical protein
MTISIRLVVLATAFHTLVIVSVIHLFYDSFSLSLSPSHLSCYLIDNFVFRLLEYGSPEQVNHGPAAAAPGCRRRCLHDANNFVAHLLGCSSSCIRRFP